MGGSSIDYDWEPTSPHNVVRTVVLVGRTGNGKSATGNNILGRQAFTSRTSLNGVTSTCELQDTVTEDGQVINVIDTPGLFDFSTESKFDGKEIVKCIDLAKDGIHAILVVLSVTNRFTKEEESALHSLLALFGSKIIDYMIVVFTGGDVFEGDQQTLEDYLHDCPKPLKDILDLCQNRRVLFDNKNMDESKRAKQVGELLSLVNTVIQQNGGQPYTDEWFAESRKEHIQKSDDDPLKRIAEMIELKLKEAITRLEQKLAEEQAARQKAEENAQLAQEKWNDEIRKLRENLERAQMETEELRKQVENRCAIL